MAKGSAADVSGRVAVNDQIIEVDGRSLYGYTNHQAVEVLRSTGRVVKLRIARYLRGIKYEQLHQAIASTADMQPLQQQPQNPPSRSGSTFIQVESFQSHVEDDPNDGDFSNEPIVSDKSLYAVLEVDDIEPMEVRNVELEDKWSQIMGPDYFIIVSIAKSNAPLNIDLQWILAFCLGGANQEVQRIWRTWNFA